MKLAWRVATVSFLLLASCTLFVLVHRLNPTKSLQARDVPLHSSLRISDPEQTLPLRFREPAVTQERSLLSATSVSEILIRNSREPRIEKSSTDTGASNDRLASPTIARNVTRQQGLRIERASSTANTSTNMKISQTSPARAQNYYEAEGRKRSEWENVFGIRKVSNATEVQASSNQKQSKHRYETEPQTVHATSSLHSVITTTETHQSEEHKSGIAVNQPGIGEMARPPSPRNSLTNSEEPLVEFVMQKNRARQNIEAARNKIMLTIRTTMSLHEKRLPVLFDTWLTTVNASNVFLVTDGFDEDYINRTKQLGKAILIKLNSGTAVN